MTVLVAVTVGSRAAPVVCIVASSHMINGLKALDVMSTVVTTTIALAGMAPAPRGGRCLVSPRGGVLGARGRALAADWRGPPRWRPAVCRRGRCCPRARRRMTRSRAAPLGARAAPERRARTIRGGTSACAHLGDRRRAPEPSGRAPRLHLVAKQTLQRLRLSAAASRVGTLAPAAKGPPPQTAATLSNRGSSASKLCTLEVREGVSLQDGWYRAKPSTVCTKRPVGRRSRSWGFRARLAALGETRTANVGFPTE